jgi:hypothetical protein
MLESSIFWIGTKVAQTFLCKEKARIARALFIAS